MSFKTDMESFGKIVTYYPHEFTVDPWLQNLRDADFLTSLKNSVLIAVCAMAVCFHFAYVLFTMIGVGTQIGFHLDGFSVRDIFWCLTVILQITAMQSFIVFIAFLLRKASTAISVSVCFSFITCNILRNFLEGKVFELSCFYFAQDTSGKNLFFTSLFAVIVFGAMTGAAYFVFSRADIK